MAKQIHPENMIRGNWYSIAYQAGETLCKTSGVYVGMMITERVLFLQFESKREPKCIIPYKKIVEIGPNYNNA